MNKLSDTFRKSINPAFSCINELVVLPEVGDCGFVEYFEHKADAVISRKAIYSIVDNQSTLMLEYPAPDCKPANVFELFFESPSVVANNQKFEGLFGIDISNYVKRLDHEKFEDLISYIKSNPEIVFVLFFYSDDAQETERVHTMLMKHMDIVKTVLPVPDSSQLLAYTMEGIEKLCARPEGGIKKLLEDFFAENAVGYDAADYLLRHLKLSGFRGKQEELEVMLSTLNLQAGSGYKYSGLGY